MRYRLAVFLLLAIMSLLAILPRRSVLAAPAPEPYAILDIGPPEAEGETMEEYRQAKIRGFLHPIHGVALDVRADEEVRKLDSFPRQIDARPWLTKNLRVTAIPHTRHLRLEFRVGNRKEQAVILNSFLRNYLRWYANYRKWREKIHCEDEAYVARLPQGSIPSEALQARMSKDRILIEAYKQIAVVQWAK